MKNTNWNTIVSIGISLPTSLFAGCGDENDTGNDTPQGLSGTLDKL